MLPSEMPLKNDDRLSIRLPGDILEKLAAIQEKHGLTPTEIARRLLEQVCEFYTVHGYFAFPVRIFPEAEFLTSVLQTTETAADREKLRTSELARAKSKNQKSA